MKSSKVKIVLKVAKDNKGYRVKLSRVRLTDAGGEESANQSEAEWSREEATALCAVVIEERGLVERVEQAQFHCVLPNTSAIGALVAKTHELTLAMPAVSTPTPEAEAIKEVKS